MTNESVHLNGSGAQQPIDWNRKPDPLEVEERLQKAEERAKAIEATRPKMAEIIRRRALEVAQMSPGEFRHLTNPNSLRANTSGFEGPVA